jgi:glycosyltransferase involved in cell wall biosynthesis
MPVRPLVSILIPAYNPRFFESCFASSIAQSYENIEIIVADDSGGNEIRDVVARPLAPHVRYLRNPARLGFHGNFAHLFSQASGRYIKFLNDDDVLHPDCVSNMVAAFEFLGSQASLVTSRRQRIDETGKMLPDTAATKPLADDDRVFKGRPLGDRLLLQSVNRVGEPSAAMFRRSDVSPSGDTLFRIVERKYTCLADMALWLRLLAAGDMAYLAKPLSFIRDHPGQLQWSDEVAPLCMVERYYLPRDCRSIGFLDDDAKYEAALRYGISLVQKGLSYANLGASARALFEEAQRQITSDAAAGPQARVDGRER